MLILFVDEYPRQLDDKGRFVIPAKVRELLGTKVNITRSPSDPCIYVYTDEEWERISAEVTKLPVTTDRNAAAFVRMFYAKASVCEIDKQGRVTLDKRFIKHAGLEKDIVLVGVNSRLEIWDSEMWEDYQDSLAGDFVLESIKEYNLNI